MQFPEVGPGVGQHLAISRAGGQDHTLSSHKAVLCGWMPEQECSLCAGVPPERAQHSMVLPHQNTYNDLDKQDGALTLGPPLQAPQPQARLHRPSVKSKYGNKARQGS